MNTTLEKRPILLVNGRWTRYDEITVSAPWPKRPQWTGLPLPYKPIGETVIVRRGVHEQTFPDVRLRIGDRRPSGRVVLTVMALEGDG